MDKSKQFLHDRLYPKTPSDMLKESIKNLDKDREEGDLQTLLRIPEGRRFLWRLLSITGIFRASMTGDAMTTAFNEGRRDIGLLVLNEINKSDHAAYAKMQSEHYSKQKSEQAQIEKIEAGGNK